MLLFPLVALLLACQPQPSLAETSLFSRLASFFTTPSLTHSPTESVDTPLPHGSDSDSGSDKLPTFPPAEGFCTNVNCLAENIPTRISHTSSVHLNKYEYTREGVGKEGSGSGSGSRHSSVIRYSGQKSQSVAAKFRSLSRRTLAIYWDDGREGVYQGLLRPGLTTQSNSYMGHRFFFTEEKDKSKVVGVVTIDKDKILNVIRDEEFPLGELHPVTQQTVREEEYDREYMAKHEGLRWRHFFGDDGPRPPPVLNMWPAEAIGHVHEVNSSNGYWRCDGISMDCQDNTPVTARLEVVSTRPKVFLIDDFLSDYETEHIKALASPNVKESTVGNNDGGGVLTSSTRTSKNTWIPRSSSAVTDTISRRVADVLGLDEAILWTSKNAEDMQVVHYKDQQRYDPHTDWGVQGHPESRFITLLLYLNDPVDANAGGETAFPKGNCDDFVLEEGCGFKVTPKKGMAALFYNLLEDGNGDDLSLHAALPVTRGEKWLANFWIWDPKRHH